MIIMHIEIWDGNDYVVSVIDLVLSVHSFLLKLMIEREIRPHSSTTLEKAIAPSKMFSMDFNGRIMASVGPGSRDITCRPLI